MSQHNAPSVSYPLGRSHWQAWVLSGFWLAAALLIGAWILATQHLGWRQLAGVVAVIGSGLAAYYGWKNSPVGNLGWDGQVWRWDGPGYQAGIAEYELVAAADFKNVMLLRIENQAHAKLWLWAERRAFPAHWLDLRRAVFSHRRASQGVGSPS